MTALSLDQAVRHITSTEPIFEITEAEIRDVTYSVFKNVPSHVSALLQAGRAMQGHGTAEYLVFGSERWTFDQFREDCNRMAVALQSQFGVQPGDRIAIAMRNNPEFLILIMAIASLGATTVFLNAWWTTEELDYAVVDSGARIIFADGARIERLKPIEKARDLTVIGVRDGAPMTQCTFASLSSQASPGELAEPQISADDDFAIMYSSGTTGHPKGVVQTHRGAINAVFTWLMQVAMKPLVDPPGVGAAPAPRPSILVVTPLFHVTATHPVFLLSIPAGAKLVLLSKWDPDDAVRVIRDENITRFLGVPTQSADLIDAARRLGEPLSSLNFLAAGGAKRPASQVGELKRAFPAAEIATGWGMTETNANGIGMAGEDYLLRPEAAGRLYPPVQELRILDPAGRELGVGEVGEITVKSPCNMRCYLNKPDATAEVLRDGWLRTGDLGMVDADGFVTIVDRKKNIIIRGGENIACLDVEGALHRHPAVAEACAFAVPHDRLGEVVGAGIQIRAGHDDVTAEDLTRFLAGHIARFKIPEHYWFRRSALPRGPTDKIDRRVLRAACLETLGTDEDTT